MSTHASPSTLTHIASKDACTYVHSCLPLHKNIQRRLLTCVTGVVCLSIPTLAAVQVYVPVWSGVTSCNVNTFTPFRLVLVTGRSLLCGMRGKNVQVSSGIGEPVAAQSKVTFSPVRDSIIVLVTDMNWGERGFWDLGKTSSWPSELYLDFFVSKFVAKHLTKQ
jgi:hypothetical protein